MVMEWKRYAQVTGNRIDGSIVISNNTIHGFVSHGIYANLMKRGTITHNTVYDNSTHGIQAYPAVESSEIAYNVCHGNQSGILLHGYYNSVHHNVCYENGFGIMLYADDYLTENHARFTGAQTRPFVETLAA